MMPPEDFSSSSTAVAGTRPLDVDALLRRYGAHFPAVDEELQKRVEFAAQAADERTLRVAFDERRKLYADRTGPEQPKPVRQKNLALLQQIDVLAPKLEQHIAAVRAWRSLAEAADLLHQKLLPRGRLRLKEAAAVLDAHPHAALRTWWQDLSADAEAPGAQPLLAPPQLTSARTAEARVGEPFAFAVETTPAADAFSAEGVPAGLSFDRARGTLTGVPAEAGTFVVQLGATNASGVATARLTLTVRPAVVSMPPLLVVPAEAAAVVGQSFACSFALHPPDTPVEAAGLPAGLTLDAGAKRIAGVPTSVGESVIDLVATGPGGRATGRLVLRVAPAPTPLRPPKLVLPAGPLIAHVGEAWRTTVGVEPAGADLLIEETPPGLALEGRGVISGVPAQAGFFVVLLTASSAGGVDRGVLRIEVRAPAAVAAAPPPLLRPSPEPARISVADTPARSAAPATPPVEPCERVTLHLAGGRRLHVFAGPVVRAGRLAESDLPLVACWPGNEAGTVAINREISRKHCEFSVAGDVARVFDGWREGGATESVASTFGTFVDAYRAATSGTGVKTGQIVKLTGRPAGKEIPHWRVTVVDEAALPTAPAVVAGALATARLRVLAVYFRRQDLVPDDVLILPAACDLQGLGAVTTPCWIWHTRGGFQLVRGNDVIPLAEIASIVPGATMGGRDQVRSHTLAEAIQLAVKR